MIDQEFKMKDWGKGKSKLDAYLEKVGLALTSLGAKGFILVADDPKSKDTVVYLNGSHHWILDASIDISHKAERDMLSE